MTPEDLDHEPPQIIIAPPPPDAERMPRRLDESWLFAIGLFVVFIGGLLLAFWLISNYWVESDDQKRPPPVGSQRYFPEPDARLTMLRAAGESPPSLAPSPSHTA